MVSITNSLFIAGIGLLALIGIGGFRGNRNSAVSENISQAQFDNDNANLLKQSIIDRELQSQREQFRAEKFKIDNRITQNAVFTGKIENFQNTITEINTEISLQKDEIAKAQAELEQIGNTRGYLPQPFLNELRNRLGENIPQPYNFGLNNDRDPRINQFYSELNTRFATARAPINSFINSAQERISLLEIQKQELTL